MINFIIDSSRRFIFCSIICVIFVSIFCGFGLKRTEETKMSGTTSLEAPPSSATVWVGRNDGAKYCVQDSGETLEQGSTQLQAAQIAVLDSKKGADGKMHAQVCGGGRGSTNNYLINRDRLAAAKALGYSEVSILR